MKKVYAAIDLKSFYASVECKERGLNPITTNLVVADESRTEKTICLAVSPALKSYGIPGRARLFEVIQKVNQINNERRRKAPNFKFTGKSFNYIELKNNPNFEYITMSSGDEKNDSNIKNATTVDKKSESAFKVSNVNINTATQTELETLPGIGPSLALKIINYRKENGKFKSIEELKSVNGIGENKYEEIKKYIYV